MQIDSSQKQPPITFSQPYPKRSLSYNDLKRKRLIRSEKSKSKLKPQVSQNMILHTQKKKPQDKFSIGLLIQSNKVHDAKKKDHSINDFKDVFEDIKERTKNKKYIISKPSYLDKNGDDKKKITFFNKSGTGNSKSNLLYQSLDLAENQKEIIKNIIEKKKSQRRLLKFDEIRAEVKRSKSKSKLLDKEEETAPNSNINNSLSQEVSGLSKSIKTGLSKSIKKIRVKKFQTVNQPNVQNSNSKKQLKNQNFKNYQTAEVTQRQCLSQKCYNKERRKLKIEDFKTDRKKFENGKKKDDQGLYRKLKKTASEIAITTITEDAYNKNKYSIKKQSQSTLFITPLTLKPEEDSVHKTTEPQIRVQFQNRDALKDLELSDIDISAIQTKKDGEFVDISGEISFVQAIQAQEIELQMKNSQFISAPTHDAECKKKSVNEKTKNNQNKKIFNVQNGQNFSNILDALALPTQQLKTKISKRSNKVVKKKNELQMFKKIFPANFFNK